MAGTGFFDNWEPVDTTKEPVRGEPAATVADLPSTSSTGVTVAQAPPLEALIDEAPDAPEQEPAEPAPLPPVGDQEGIH